MTKIQKLVSLAAAFVLMVGLSACAVNGQDYEPDQVSEFVITLDDGSKVPCVKHEEFYGFDCNWDKVTRPSHTPIVKP